MKKLLLLLILSFFSAQGLAGGCPDGSDPVKSVSADGTYFVYNCGGNSNDDSSQAETKGIECSLANNYGRINDAYVVPDRWTCLQTPLMDIEIPENWKLIDDYDRYQDMISRNVSHRLFGFKGHPPGSVCAKMFQKYEQYPWNRETESGFTIADCLDDLRSRLYEGDKNYAYKLLELWATADHLKQPKDTEPGPGDYAWIITINHAAGIYAQEKDNIDFSDTFKSWLTSRLMNAELRAYGVSDTRYRCRDILSQFKEPIWINDCSTTRFALTEAWLLGGLALNNKELFDKGIDSLQYITTLFNNDNLHPWISRGVRSLSYSSQIPSNLSQYAILLDTVGYDFMEHKMPNGSKVYEVAETYFDFLWEDDLSQIWPYIKLNVGTNNNQKFDELLKPIAEREHYIGYFPSRPQQVVRQSIRYVDVYEPELKEEFGYEEVYSKFVKGTRDFSDVYEAGQSEEYEMFHSAGFFDGHSVYKASDKVFLAEQEGCITSELNGEYIATWFFVDVNNNQEPDLQGSESLFLNECVGEFEGVESFQPSKALRKDLQVTYKTNGQITISGHIDLWEVGQTKHTVLKGDVNSGVISGRWEEGDLIKIEITNTELAAEAARRAAEEEAIEKEIVACEVSEFDGEYLARWFFGNVNNNAESELQGSESLFLNGCVGEFEGMENFQPAKELRKDLQVTYKTNGQITISGHIDLWDVGRSFHTVLKGDLNSGEISGVWEEGDLIKIEITKVNN